MLRPNRRMFEPSTVSMPTPSSRTLFQRLAGVGWQRRWKTRHSLRGLGTRLLLFSRERPGSFTGAHRALHFRLKLTNRRRKTSEIPEGSIHKMTTTVVLTLSNRNRGWQNPYTHVSDIPFENPGRTLHYILRWEAGSARVNTFD